MISWKRAPSNVLLPWVSNVAALLAIATLLAATRPVAAQAGGDRLTLAERVAMKRTATRGPIELPYDLPRKGYVTLVVEDPTGRRVRNLIGDSFRPAGQNVDYWDGADDEGRLVTPGTYRVRGLHHQELVPVFEFAFGTPGDPPWESVDGRGAWLSDMNAPEAVAADDERVYLAAPYAHDGSAVMAVDDDGRKQWGIKADYHGDSGTALALDETYLYVGVDSFRRRDTNRLVLYRVDKRTGDYVPFPDGEIWHRVGKYERALFPRPRLPGDWISAGDHNPDWARCGLMGLAERDGMLFMSSYWQDRILVIDAAKGETVGYCAVPRPAGVAVDSQGRLLVVSDKQVVVVDPNTEGVSTLISAQGEGLAAPFALATDGAGNIYVSDWAREMSIKVYSPTGEFLRRVGKRGGRPWVGRWDPRGMLLPRGLAVDSRGKLWVAEDDTTPKRISVWSATGDFESEYLGPAYYKNVGTHLNTHDPTRALVALCELKLDWEAGTWEPVSTVWRPMHRTALFGPRYEQHGSYRTLRKDGREFLISSTRWVTISEREGDRYRPLAALGNVEETVWRIQPSNRGPNDLRRRIPLLDENRTPPERRHIIKEPDLIKFYQEATTNFHWADRNGDALVQENEITFFEAPGGKPMAWDFFWANPVSEDLTIYAYGPVGGGREIIWRLPLKGWTACGAPLHEPEKAEIFVERSRKRTPGRSTAASWVFSGERLLSTEVPIALYGADGKAQWTYPNDWAGSGAHHSPAARPGLVISPLFTLGEADLGGEVGTIFALRGDLGEDYLFTVDGLYIGNLFRDIRSGAESYPPKAVRGTVLKDVFTATGGETFGGTLIQHPTTGKVYLTIGDRAPCICEVRGLETIQRLPTTEVEFTIEQYQAAERLVAERIVDDEPRVFKLGRTKRKLEIDGSLDEWDAPVAEIFLDLNHAATARAAYDDDNLYLGYRVRDPMRLVNGGRDWATLFKTGSAVDFRIGANPKARPDRERPVVGDQRVIIAPFLGDMTAVLYKYVVPGTAEPRSFTSPVGTVDVDSVRRVEGATIAVTRQDGGYTLEAALPLEALELAPQPGEKLRGDFGVIWSDALGRHNIARSYWSNKAAGIVSDLFSEASIHPNRWGEVEIAE